MSANATATLTITGIASSGAGIAEFNAQNVFVPNTVPGDIVEVRFESIPQGAHSLKASVLSYQMRSAMRCTPLCAHAGECGACPLASIAYAQQGDIKLQEVYSAAQAAGLDLTNVEVEPVKLMDGDEPVRFRNKAILSVVRDRNEDIVLGMYRSGTHDVVRITDCPQTPSWMTLASDITRSWLNENALEPYDEASHQGCVRHLVMRDALEGGRMVLLVVTTVPQEALLRSWATQLVDAAGVTSVLVNINEQRGNRILGTHSQTIVGEGHIKARLDDLDFLVAPDTFLQVNTPQTQVLYGIALREARLSPNESVLDLYCGVGTMTLMAARRAACAIGVEIVESSVICARANAQLNHIENAHFYAGAVENVLPQLSLSGIEPTSAILDPSFKGIAPTVASTLSQLPLKRLVYVSCNPKTFCRDAVNLKTQGFELKTLIPVDLFPNTLHVEVVGVFDRVL